MLAAPERAQRPLPLLALLGCLAAGPAQAQQRIVTVSPSLTDAVCALGYCDRIVGTDRYSTGPGPVANLPKIGGMADASIERIAALHPDLVLLGPRSRLDERLAELGIPVQTFVVRTHADQQAMLRALGRTLGEPARAEALIAKIERELDAAAARLPARLRGRSVYVEIGLGPKAASSATFIGETLTRLGLVNIVGGDLGLFPKINPEWIVRRRPELIVGPAAMLSNLAQRPGWAQLPAVQGGRVCALDAERMALLERPGPRLGEAAQMLVDCLRALP
ncbi:ABC transporter substrate-binding protein [Comamonas faecalis]|uniref:ABC transporter substrate-binding protein n=1 Tax=Comamonas faecalis TaxID=1387849 RepID=A0ABP7QE27_9BURK